METSIRYVEAEEERAGREARDRSRDTNTHLKYL